MVRARAVIWVRFSPHLFNSTHLLNLRLFQEKCRHLGIEHVFEKKVKLGIPDEVTLPDNAGRRGCRSKSLHGGIGESQPSMHAAARRPEAAAVAAAVP